MKFCMPHWNALREEIEVKQNLARFVARSGKEAAQLMADELSGERRPDQGCPLMAAHNMIVSNALRFFGLFLFAEDENWNDRCPLCLAGQACRCNDCKGDPSSAQPDLPQKWIGFAGRDVAEIFAERAKREPEVVS